MPGYPGEWALFCDYAAAVGEPALPTTVSALTGFLTRVPARPATQARRVAAIAAAHRHAGYLLERPTPGVERPDCGPMIASCPTRGWPEGFAGRRDAFLIVLTGVLGYSHTLARQLRAADIETDTVLRLGGRAVPTTEDPRTCPACAVVRWLEVLGMADGLGRGSAHMHLSAASALTSTSPHSHTLTGSPRWRRAAQLLPAIDQHGWIEDYRPLSSRSISTRLALATSRNPCPDPGPPAAVELTPSDLTLEEILALLDQVADDADALNARIQALLDSGGC